MVTFHQLTTHGVTTSLGTTHGVTWSHPVSTLSLGATLSRARTY